MIFIVFMFPRFSIKALIYTTIFWDENLFVGARGFLVNIRIHIAQCVDYELNNNILTRENEVHCQKVRF